MPFVPFDGVIVNPVPLQVDPVMADMFGIGLTVTVTVKVLPVHVPEVGVTV
jgi:hypothetical protein